MSWGIKRIMEIIGRNSHRLPEGLEEKLDGVYLVFLHRLKLDKNLIVEVGVLNEDEIRNLNEEYRGKNESTDVLSFPMNPESFETMLGAIYFCPSIIERKYDDLSFGFCYLFAHSLLHLVGYEHGEEMFRLQEEIVDQAFG